MPVFSTSTQLAAAIAARILTVSCALLILAIPLHAVCTLPNPSVTCEFLNSDAVFTGKVIAVRTVPSVADNLGLNDFRYDLTVQENFRGADTKTIDVYTEDSSGRLTLTVGSEYLLFATKVPSPRGRLMITYCGNSSPLSSATNTIRELRAIKIRRDVYVEGRVSPQAFSDAGRQFPGLSVIVRSGQQTFKAITDEHGFFRLHIPPGEYSAEVEPPDGFTVEAFDLSDANPKRFRASEGRCIGLQFVVDPNKP